MRILKILLFLFCVLYAQVVSIDQLEQLYNENNYRELAKQISKVDAAAKQGSEYLFFKALVENDGKSAVSQYKRFISAFPNSRYADDALYRLAMYHYSRGDDHTCRVLLNGLLRNYPQSEFVPDVEFLIGQTYFNERQSDSAAIALQHFVQKNPRSPKVDLAVSDLESLGGISLEELQSAAEENNCFTIEVGAFNSLQVAERVAGKLEDKYEYVTLYSKTAQIKKYALCIGLFSSKENAENYAANYIKSVIKDCMIVSCSDYKVIEK